MIEKVQHSGKRIAYLSKIKKIIQVLQLLTRIDFIRLFASEMGGSCESDMVCDIK